jgi:phytanoyl-CoA hydroxylase
MIANFKKDFWENGYVIVKQLFPKERIQSLRKKAQYLFQQQLISTKIIPDFLENYSEEEFNLKLVELFQKYPERIVSTGKHIQHMIDLHLISLDSEIENRLKEIGLSFPNICTRPMLYFNSRKLAKKQVYWKTDPHQDWRSMQGSLNSIVVWLPLIDVDKSLGALEIVPKSHHFGLQTDSFDSGFGMLKEEEANKHEWVSVELEEGDALFFSTFLFHRSGENSTENGVRWSCHFRYNDMNEKEFIDRGYPHPYVYHPNPDIITPDYPKEENIRKAFNVTT